MGKGREAVCNLCVHTKMLFQIRQRLQEIRSKARPDRLSGKRKRLKREAGKHPLPASMTYHSLFSPIMPAFEIKSSRFKRIFFVCRYDGTEETKEKSW